MKAYIIQPLYSLNGKEDIEKRFNEQMAMMDECDDSADIIVLPEYCDCQSYMGSNELTYKMREKYNSVFHKKVMETAKRCKALVFANYGYKGADGLYRNVTFA